MFVKYRPVRIGDLPECLACIRDEFAYATEERKALLAFWRELIQTRAGLGAVIEDMTGERGRRIVWFCLKVFVSDEFAAYLKTESAPYVGLEILRRRQSGESPCLDESSIRRANSSTGVCIVVLNSGAPRHMRSPEKLRSLADRVAEFTFYFTAGYRCNELLQEFYDDFTCGWATGAGFRLRTDYPRQRAKETGLSLSGNPKLYGITSTEAASSAGTLASTLLNYRHPKFPFRPNEQDLLFEALLGETDEALAQSLGIALATVRKRWDAVYEKVAETCPDLLDTAARDTGGSTRGLEKKRRLLNYLRQHPEELRPHDWRTVMRLSEPDDPDAVAKLRLRYGPKIDERPASVPGKSIDIAPESPVEQVCG